MVALRSKGIRKQKAYKVYRLKVIGYRFNVQYSMFNRENRTYAINAFGIRIKRCCASCSNKIFDDKGCRICNCNDKVILNPKKCCNFWLMSESLSRAGLVRKDAPELRDLTEKIRALREHDKELKELKRQLNRESNRRMRERYKRLRVKGEG